MLPSTNESKAPQPNAWNTLAAMFSPNDRSARMHHMEPIKMDAILARSTGLLPTNLAAIEAKTEKNAEMIKGTAVKVAADRYDTE